MVRRHGIRVDDEGRIRLAQRREYGTRRGATARGRGQALRGRVDVDHHERVERRDRFHMIRNALREARRRADVCMQRLFPEPGRRGF